MDALEVSIKQESLVVRRIISGSVCVSTTPNIILDTDKPTVIAVGREAVRDAVQKTNLRELVRKRYIAVVL